MTTATINTQTVHLSETFDADTLNEKVNWSPFKASLLILAGAFLIGIIILWGGEVLNLPKFGDTTTRFTDIAAFALMFTATQHVVRVFGEVRATARKHTDVNHNQFISRVIMPAVQKVEGLKDFDPIFFTGITYEGQAGFWSRIDATQGMVYNMVLKGDILTVTNHIKQNDEN